MRQRDSVFEKERTAKFHEKRHRFLERTRWTPGVALWSEPLGELLQRTGCQRETCFVAGTLPSAPDNELYLTSFPAVTNLAVPGNTASFH